MGSKASTTQSTSQQTTQIDRRVGAQDAIVVTEGSRLGGSDISAGGNINVESIDPETIAGALGLSETVVKEFANLSKSTTGEVTSTLSDAFQSQGSALGDTLSRITDLTAAGQQNKRNNQVVIIVVAALAAGIVAIIVFVRKK